MASCPFEGFINALMLFATEAFAIVARLERVLIEKVNAIPLAALPSMCVRTSEV